MNLFRLLILVALAYLAWRLYRHLRAPPAPPAQPPPASYEPMARCSRCGVHLPASALSATGLCGRCSSP
ncbi:MAG TPA: PP0621 family protein [Solimonas sp.]|nr:PP0621 family protein [Solimonas sp.]